MKYGFKSKDWGHSFEPYSVFLVSDYTSPYEGFCLPVKLFTREIKLLYSDTSVGKFFLLGKTPTARMNDLSPFLPLNIYN